ASACSRGRLGELKPMPRSILKEETDEAGKRRMVLGTPPAEVAARFGVPTPDGPTLLMMATVDHAGAGGLCAAPAAGRHLLAGRPGGNRVATVVDISAPLGAPPPPP